MRHVVLSLLGILFVSFAVVFISSGCNYRPLKGRATVPATEISAASTDSPTALPAPETPSLLTICMGQEPSSLFLYGDSSQAARSIRQAIYDGPIDVRNYEPVPVILEKIPSLTDGDLSFAPVEVQPGGELVDSAGTPVSLAEGVSYLPSGCADASCAVIYSGQGPVQVDQQVVKFRLKPGLKWSDGEPLGADDSQYSFEVAKSLYPRARPDVILRTQSYQALDETTVEWRGVPGFRYSGFVAAFFTPLPRHAWGTINAQDLLAADAPVHKPIGWGAYNIDEWTPGDHISLSRNPNYSRSSEGLPHFERLVFRFTQSPEQAVAALLAGECDYLDETNDLQPQAAQLLEAQSAGKLKLLEGVSDAWEHIDFGVASLSPDVIPIFQSKETRQAVAQCIDRQKIVDEVFAGKTLVPDSYTPPGHPLANPDVRRYVFEPETANKLLDSVGWLDDDGNPATPRRSQAVAGVPDGTAFEINFLTTDEPEKQRIGEILRDSLAQCGITLNVNSLPGDQLFGAGQSGPIFGRNFSLAEFGWMGAWQPPCFLYTTQEIPGPYPQYPKGWGGSNPSGYSSQDFDHACQNALSSMPEQPEYRAAHYLAQSIFVEDLPAIPLYLHLKQAAARPDLCGPSLEPSADSALWNLESFSVGQSCP